MHDLSVGCERTWSCRVTVVRRLVDDISWVFEEWMDFCFGGVNSDQGRAG